MIKKYGTFYAIKYYDIIPFIIISILLLTCNNHIFNIVCDILRTTPNDEFYPFISLVYPFALWGGYLYAFYSHFQTKNYLYYTGRNLGVDKAKFKRSYSELLKYFKDAEPLKLDTTSFENETWRETKGIIFGKDKEQLIKIPSDSECNIAVFGPPGSGKTAGLAIINAMTFDGSILAVDIKGDLYKYVSTHTERHIVRFCPDSPNALEESVRYNPFLGLSQMNDTEKNLYLESMATVLVPDTGGADGSYFVTRARKLFIGITQLILAETPTVSFPDVIHAILQGNVFDWVTKAINSDCIAAKEKLSSFYGNSEKNVAGAYDALTTAIVHFSNPILDDLLSNRGHCISTETLEKGTDIYLQISQEHLDVYAPLFTLIVQSLSTQFTKRPDKSSGTINRPVLMILDEFPQLTFSYQLINSNLSTLRSKSVICLLIQQNLAQLEQRFQPTGARSILGNCNYQVILGSNDINSSKVFSETFGEMKVLKISNSKSFNSKQNTTGRSVQETTERVFPPESFGDLPSNNKMVVYFKGKYCKIDKLNCYKD